VSLVRRPQRRERAQALTGPADPPPCAGPLDGTHGASMNRPALGVILVTAFLNMLGYGLVLPVLPFMVRPFVAPEQLAETVGWLGSAYAVCVFAAAPGLGAISDRLGRRPVLLLSLLGSAVGYTIFGLGGALWVLVLGRVIDGLTGGNIGAIFSYVADCSAPQDRGRQFARVGAAIGGGFLLGPAIGGFAGQLGYAVPAYAAAGLFALNAIWGLLVLPESLAPSQRSAHLSWRQLNPVGQLLGLLRLHEVRGLLVVLLLVYVPFAALQTTLSVLALDHLGWQPDQIGLVLLLVGVGDIIVQAWLMGVLLPRLGETRVALLGLLLQITGYGLLGLVALLPSAGLLIGGSLSFGLGDALLGPSLNGLLSRSVGPRQQGRIQGGAQATQSLGRVLGPLAGGLLYSRAGHASPFWLGGLCVALAVATLLRPGTSRAAPVDGS